MSRVLPFPGSSIDVPPRRSPATRQPFELCTRPGVAGDLLLNGHDRLGETVAELRVSAVVLAHDADATEPIVDAFRLLVHSLDAAKWRLR